MACPELRDRRAAMLFSLHPDTGPGPKPALDLGLWCWGKREFHSCRETFPRPVPVVLCGGLGTFQPNWGGGARIKVQMCLGANGAALASPPPALSQLSVQSIQQEWAKAIFLKA